jgi:hypothetical protein
VVAVPEVNGDKLEHRSEGGRVAMLQGGDASAATAQLTGGRWRGGEGSGQSKSVEAHGTVESRASCR